MATQSGTSGIWRKLRLATWTGLALFPAWAEVASAAPPAALGPRLLNPNIANDPNRRVVAFIHGNVPIYRDELGEYLLSRGGMEKVELLVNRRMIEVAATRAGVTVTPNEIEAGLNDDLHGAQIDVAAFTQYINERYGKSIFEWKQDVIRPRLLLGKLCHKEIVITPEELQKRFESRYGEKREAQLIVWPKKGVTPLTEDQKGRARTSPAEFDKLAALQPDAKLAQSDGHLNPIGRHIDGEDPDVEKALFSLKEGEISPWIETKTNWTCIRCLKIIPPADPKLTLDNVRKDVEKDVFDRKMNAAIPGQFAKIKKEANPQLTKQVPLPAKFDPANPPARIDHPDPKVLAVVYGNIAITKEDLGDFLIVRGGFEKMEMLVNKRIIEYAAAKQGVSLSPEEIEIGKKQYIAKLGIENIRYADFVKHVLPKRKLTEFAWLEDVLKPELLMTKICRDRVKIEEEDLKKAFATKYGERRRAKIILWKKDEFRIATKQWGEARKSDADFDRIARAQSDPNLASAAGAVSPIGRYVEAENPMIVNVLFSLKQGEMSQLFETPAGIMCVKFIGIVPAAINITLDQVRESLRKEVFEHKLSRELGMEFGKLKQAATPNILLRGPTSIREFEEGNRRLIQQAVGGASKP